jgi:hypothetical protein
MDRRTQRLVPLFLAQAVAYFASERTQRPHYRLTAKRTAAVAMLLLSCHALPGHYKRLKCDINRVANFQVTGVVTEEKIFITMQN